MLLCTVFTSEVCYIFSGFKKSTPTSPGYQQNSLDGTVIKGISSQEAIVERAKQVSAAWHNTRNKYLPDYFSVIPIIFLQIL